MRTETVIFQFRVSEQDRRRFTNRARARGFTLKQWAQRNIGRRVPGLVTYEVGYQRMPGAWYVKITIPWLPSMTLEELTKDLRSAFKLFAKGPSPHPQPELFDE